MSEQIAGSCLCGAVSFSVQPPSLFCGHCHCSMCRRNHGAGYVTWFAVPRSQFALETGALELTRYRSSDHGTRSFCRICGSSLFCETNSAPDKVDIVLANMHGPIDRLPEIHIFFDDRIEWMVVDDDLPRLGGPTGLEPLDAEPKSSRGRAKNARR